MREASRQKIGSARVLLRLKDPRKCADQPVSTLLRVLTGSFFSLNHASLSDMKKFSMAVLCATLAGALSAQAPPPKTSLKVGDTAPDFELPSTQQGKKFKLSDFRGKKTVVVAFFPAAFTGG